MVGSVRLGGDGTFTLARSAKSTATAGRTTYVVGQASGNVATQIGGDLSLEGGAGLSAGRVRIGESSEAIIMGQSGKTATIAGNLAVNAVSVTALLRSADISASGAVTAATSLTTGALSAATAAVSGSVTIGGSILVGGASAVTIGRPANTVTANGQSTYILGQDRTGGVGGDLLLDAGTGAAAGNVKIGHFSTGVTMGDPARVVTVRGHLAANTASVSGLLNAASATLTGALSAATVTTGSISAASALTAAGISSAQSVSVTGSVSASGTLTAVGAASLGSLQTGAAAVSSLSASGIVTAAGLTSTGTVSAATVSASGARVVGVITSAGLTSSAAITASGLSTGAVTAGAVTVSSVSSSGALSGSALSTSGSVTIGDQMVVGPDAAFTISRPAHVGGSAGQPTVIVGQTATAAAGGDVVIEAGCGSGANGAVRIGQASERVDIGLVGKTTYVAGGLVMNSGSVSGLLNAASLSSAGSVSAASLSVGSGLTSSGSSQLVGSIQLGDNALFTIRRAVYSTQNAGRSTYIIGQQAGDGGSMGGDLHMEAGSGGNNGRVVIGATARSLHLGSLTAKATVNGLLEANSASVSGPLSASSLSITSGITAASVTAASLTAGSASISGSTQLSGNVRLGGDSLYTLSRTPVSSGKGHTTFIRLLTAFSVTTLVTLVLARCPALF